MRLLLWPLALIYRLIVAIRNSLFDWGLFPTSKVNCPVISVGNLSVGGTGKTPWVVYLVDKLQSQGLRVGVVSRGYRGDYKGLLKVSPETLADDCGDEPLMIYQRTKAPVYVCRDRVQAARTLCGDGLVDVIIMDDGFQHRWLKRDVNIVIVDVSQPLWKYELLPMGELREPPSSLRRAHICVLNKWNLATEKQRGFVSKMIGPYSEGAELVLKSQYSLADYEPVFPGQAAVPQLDKVFLLSAIAVPESFVRVVKQHNVFPVDEIAFADHHLWNEDEILAVFAKMKKRGCRDLLITEKDKVKLSRFEQLFKMHGINLWVFKIELKVLENETEFLAYLQERIGQK